MTKQTEATLQRSHRIPLPCSAPLRSLVLAYPERRLAFPCHRWPPEDRRRHARRGGHRYRLGGRCIAIELKAKGRSQSPAQKAWADQFTTAGGTYAVCRSLDAVERFLDSAGIPLRASVGGAS